MRLLLWLLLAVVLSTTAPCVQAATTVSIRRDPMDGDVFLNPWKYHNDNEEEGAARRHRHRQRQRGLKQNEGNQQQRDLETTFNIFSEHTDNLEGTTFTILSETEDGTPEEKVTTFDIITPEPEDETDVSMACHYAGTIQLTHPMSIGRNDVYYVLGSQMLQSAHITMDQINAWPKCGVRLRASPDAARTSQYGLSVQTFGDESSPNLTVDIGNYIVETKLAPTDFMLAGYSSTLTKYLSPIAHHHQRVLITAGSTATDVHEDKPSVFGMLPTSDTFLDNAFLGLSEKGAQTVAYLTEEGVPLCLPGRYRRREASDLWCFVCLELNGGALLCLDATILY